VRPAGIEAILAGPASALLQVVDFGPHQRLLDIGGGTGSWSIAIAQHHQHHRMALRRSSPARRTAKPHHRPSGLSSRLDHAAADGSLGTMIHIAR
jgi:cyclopropane fatty-acyl-phospholipid synthase-like methyltransferase